LNHWPEAHIWDELQARLATDDGWSLEQGPITQKGIPRCACDGVEPMHYGTLFLAGDAAHIGPSALRNRDPPAMASSASIYPTARTGHSVFGNSGAFAVIAGSLPEVDERNRGCF
jgi:hypothetical protein